MTARTIQEIATEIVKDWYRPNPKAQWQLSLMLRGDDSDLTILIFLAHALEWRTEKSDDLKVELIEKIPEAIIQW